MADTADLVFNTASQQAQNAGAGLSDAVHSGAQLALQKEQNDIEQAKLQQAQQALQQAKIQKLYDFIGNASKYQNAGDRQNYLKSAIGMRNATGIPAQSIPDDQIMQLGTNENSQRMYTLQTAVNAGQMTPWDAIDLATNPLKADKFAAVPMTPLEFMGKSPDLSGSQENFLKQQTQLQSSTGRAEAMQQRNTNTAFDQSLKSVSDSNPNLKALLQSYQNLDNATNNWKQGKQTSQDMHDLQAVVIGNMGIRGSSTGEERAKRLAGSAGISLTEATQYLTGDPESVMQTSPKLAEYVLHQAGLEMQNKRSQVDQALDVGTKKISPLIKANPQYMQSVVDTREAFRKQFTPRPDAAGATAGGAGPTANIGGHQMTTQQMQAFITQFPQNPLVPQMQQALKGSGGQ